VPGLITGGKTLIPTFEFVKHKGMFTPEDIRLIKARGSNHEEVLQQIEYFRKGFPFLKITEAATGGKGIIRLSDDEIQRFEELYDRKTKEELSIIKFVPASGAASRMFKSLFSALEHLKEGKKVKKVLKSNKDAKEFMERMSDFAFYSELMACLDKAGEKPGLETCLEYLLTDKGLNYGKMPKGLLLFHRYEGFERTPFEEHLAEGALYAMDHNKHVKVHFTVSPDHEKVFRQLFEKIEAGYEIEYGAIYNVSFSHQHPSTDTIAVKLDNEPFRKKDGSLLFRPAGHGALLENLNDLDADLVFIKNIDNVVPDKFKEATVLFKKVLAGLLLHYQERIFEYQKMLNERHPQALESGFLAAAANFLENSLNVKPPDDQYYTEKEELVQYLKEKYNRPLRVCGMVKNQGEPGGGPFFACNPDGTVSLQIAESVQIDTDDPVQVKISRRASHFNPVDLVCGLKNYKGEKYNLLLFRDPATGLISKKSKDGKDLKAQELPGLWNGSMSDWNTLFVEVPVETFNPVKTVNDLLRKEHQ
jgi:hypothetical protein